MKRYTACSIALLVVLSGTAWADDLQLNRETQVAPTVTLLDAPVAVIYSGEVRGPRVVDPKFWSLGAALNAAMVLDTRSTFDALRRCVRCQESNPYAAPFVNRGPVVAFTAGEIFDVSIMALAAKMRGSTQPQIRRLWWLVPAALTSAHLVAYQHNRGIR